MRDKAKLNGLSLNNKCLDKDCCTEDLIEIGRVDYVGMRQLHNHMQPQLRQTVSIFTILGLRLCKSKTPQHDPWFLAKQNGDVQVINH